MATGEITVMKFGGAALRDGAGVRRAVAIVDEHGGRDPVVVVSALEGVTDLLVQAARAAARGEVNVEAVRVGDFKYTRQKALYNLREDISEKTNIREAHPEKAEEMQKLITAFVAEVKADVEARKRIIQAMDSK